MRTLFDTIEHWKNIGEWEQIKIWYVQTDTQERYYNIIKYIQTHRGKYGRNYRDKILAEPEFIAQFGYLTSSNIDDAFKLMFKCMK